MDNYEYWRNSGPFWNDEYRIRRGSQFYYVSQEILINHIVSTNGVKSVLDYGCGVGRHIKHLGRNKKLKIFGYDQSESMLAGTKNWLTDIAAFVELKSGMSTGPLPYKSKSLDIAFTSEVLLHSRSEDISKILGELCRVARRFVFHIEPHADYSLEVSAHAGCWYHDLVSAYKSIGVKAVRMGRTSHAQELTVADLDGSFESVDSMLKLLNEAENVLQPTLEMARHGQLGNGVLNAGGIQLGKPSDAEGWPFPYPLCGTLPLAIQPTAPAATQEEIQLANSIRERFFLPGGPGAYMVDFARAFRIAKGAEIYVEVGSQDKGNIAFVSQFLAPNALIVDIDIEHVPAATERIKDFLPDGMLYEQILGDSVSYDTHKRLQELLNGRRIDLALLDSSHIFDHFMKEFNIYFPLLRANGVLFVHDVFWEGDELYKGKAQALEIVDRYHPVYAIHENRPLHRYARLGTKNDTWGGVGLVVKNG